MANLGHNEDLEFQHRLQHFFFPGTTNFTIEIFLAGIVLIIINLGALSEKIFAGDPSENNPVGFASDGIDNFWDNLNNSRIFENIAVFALWAIAGVLMLSLVFKVIQIFIKMFYSADDASKFVKAQRGFGIIFWLISLQGFFKHALAIIAGLLCMYLGGLIGLNIASGQLRDALWLSFPDNIGHFVLCLIALTVGIRLFISGVGLVFPKFSRWYYA